MNTPLRFPAPNGSTVLFNSSHSDIFISPKLTVEKLKEVFRQHESFRLMEYWTEAILITSPHSDGNWIEGLRTRKIGEFDSHAYFQADELREISGTRLKGVDLIGHLRALPIEQQRSMFRTRIPQTRLDMRKVLRTRDVAFAPDFDAMLSKCGGVLGFMNALVDAARTNLPGANPIYHQVRYLELLTLLWNHGLILLPLDFPAWKSRYKWVTASNVMYTVRRIELVERIVDAFKLEGNKALEPIAHTFILATDMSSISDLSPELIDAHEQHAMTWAIASAEGKSKESIYAIRSAVSRVGQTLRILFNSAYPHLAVQETRRTVVRSTPLRTDGKFEWLSAARPELGEWATIFRCYVGQLTTARISNQVDRLNFFGDYLVSLAEPPLSPSAVVRRVHIIDPTLSNANTFANYLEQEIPDKGRRTSVLKLVGTVFDWYSDNLVNPSQPDESVFINPVLANDSLGKGRPRGGQTGRDALPSYILEELKSVLTENDFAFGKSLNGHIVTVVDSQNGDVVKAWAPMLTVCLYLISELPTRSHQGRWLDSGLLDETIYDPGTGRNIKNSSPFAIKGRREGALRLMHDSLRSADWLGLWVNTNKTPAVAAQGGGYLIPYVSDRLAKLLQFALDWQRRFLPPIEKPIAYYDLKHSITERQRVADAGPQIAPLFRDVRPITRDAPITYDRLVTFYTHAMAAVQQRIFEKHGHTLSLVTKNEDGTLKWVVDLHSLRVSGITAMIENGVPLEVVSQFVAGHATLVMTLHYLKFSPLKIRKILEDAHAKAQSSMDFVGSELFMGNLDDFAPFMLGQEGAGIGSGVSELKQKTGIFTISQDGICPGTSCETGGPPDSTKVKHGPVPGGKRCGLCRHWITGPAHLLGQVASVNNLAYQIRKKGLEVAKLNDERLDAEDAGDKRNAREIRDRVETLNRELNIDVNEWAARYRYAEQSVNLLEKYLETRRRAEGTAVPVEFITASSGVELKVTLEESHEFALLDQITQTSEFVTGFTNREAELEKTTILSRMMCANGLAPLLLTLDEKSAHEAGNLLSSLLLKQVDSRDLDDVLSGKRKLESYPSLSEAVKSLATLSSGFQTAMNSDSLSEQFSLHDGGSDKHVKQE